VRRRHGEAASWNAVFALLAGLAGVALCSLLPAAMREAGLEWPRGCGGEKAADRPIVGGGPKVTNGHIK